jgi:hypothetical protein
VSLWSRWIFVRFVKQSEILEADAKFFCSSRIARFVLVQQTNMGKYTKMAIKYQMAKNIPKCQ